jgi:hypothetical protein
MSTIDRVDHLTIRYTLQRGLCISRKAKPPPNRVEVFDLIL